MGVFPDRAAYVRAVCGKQIQELILYSRLIKIELDGKSDGTYPNKQGSAAGGQSDRKVSLKSSLAAEIQFDVEFAIKDDELYFLQVRPITTFDRNAPVIILDNSNIVESYPGITLPLTQSFIKEAYYQVFKNLLIHLTEDADAVKKIDETLQLLVLRMQPARSIRRCSSLVKIVVSTLSVAAADSSIV